MNWESKFASIVHETETNLAKVKEKLQSQSGSSPNSTTVEYFSPRNTTSNGNYCAQLSSTLLSRHGSGSGESAGQNYTNRLLQERIDEQNRVIVHLQEVVENLQRERNDYRTHVRTLTNDVGELSSQMLSQGTSPHLQWQMEQMKREMSRDVQDVKDELHFFRSRVENRIPVDSLRNKQDSYRRHDIHEELYLLKKEVNILRRRVGTVEQDVESSGDDKNEFTRSKERRNLSFNTTGISDARTRRLVEILQTCPDADENMEPLRIEDIRSTVTNLKKKLSSVEGRLTRRPINNYATYLNGTGTRLCLPTNKSTHMLDMDSDFSDDDDDDSDDDDDDDIDVSDLSSLIDTNTDTDDPISSDLSRLSIYKTKKIVVLNDNDNGIDDYGSIDTDELKDLDIDDFNILDDDLGLSDE